ncbi:Transducin/WD40 repeat-like superfamily protein, partial [Prunus dulcis]
MKVDTNTDKTNRNVRSKLLWRHPTEADVEKEFWKSTNSLEKSDSILEGVQSVFSFGRVEDCQLVLVDLSSHGSRTARLLQELSFFFFWKRRKKTKHEADSDERAREALDVFDIRQGGGPPFILRQGPQGVWFADNGERLGTYRGHNGAVWCGDFTRDSARFITGSADQTAKLWNVQTGQQLFTFNFDSPARSVGLSVGDRLAVITTDPFMELSSAIHVKRIAKDPADQVGESALILKGPQEDYKGLTIISAGEDAVIRIWDSETGKLLKENDKEVGHKKTITSLAKSVDGSHFLTGSLDKSAKAPRLINSLWDIRTLTLIKTYVTERPVNAVAMSPLLDHVVLGGGQDASAVTTTDHRAGKFEAKFYDRVLQEEIGGAKGHFGPIIVSQVEERMVTYVYITLTQITSTSRFRLQHTLISILTLERAGKAISPLPKPSVSSNYFCSSDVGIKQPCSSISTHLSWQKATRGQVADVINDVTTLRQQLKLFLPSGLSGLVEPKPCLGCFVLSETASLFLGPPRPGWGALLGLLL